MRFDIFNGSALVGWSALERGDAPMGCAFGRFYPEPEYVKIKNYVISTHGSIQDQLQLNVRTSEGEVLEPVGGVRITDLSAELGEEEGLHVEVLGVGYPGYERLFPLHVRAYNELFKTK